MNDVRGEEAQRIRSPLTPSPLAEGDGLVTTDLYLMFEDVADQLLARLDAAGRSSETGRDRSDEDVLDCFLLAAALNQILEDYLHRDFFALLSASAQLWPISRPASWLA